MTNSGAPSADAARDAARNAVFVTALQLGGDGPRVGVKDSIDIAGYPTTAASAALADVPPAPHHAAVVQALLDAGCRIVGKTNMHELAYGVTGINHWTGTPVNPRYPDRVPGGSSSGSAVAVAAHRVDFSVGTDTGGSIRIPAACCGIYGLKPTFGRVSRAGVHPPTSSLDCVGPFAGDLDVLEHAMALMDPTFVIQAPPATVTVGLLDVAADPAISAAVHAALTDAHVAVTVVHLPSFEDAYAAGLTIISAENWVSYGHLTGSAALGADVRARLLAARGITRDALAAAVACRVRFRAEVDALLEQVDVLALPTMPEFPLTLEAAADALASLRMTALVRPFNVSGHPALTIPLDTPQRLPAGLQLVGRRGADAELCAIAHRIVDPQELQYP